MKYQVTSLVTAALFGITIAAPLQEREVPQEHSHEPILVSVRESLKIKNPLDIQDPVFGLLGDKAAAEGAGQVKNLACLQRATADQAFTNAKNADDKDGMANALIYAALERNTGAVGKESDACKDPAVNPEINALKQHQDPASTGAKENNKEIVLALAKQLQSIGADPQLAAQSATFAPGKIGDTTAAGNTCDDKDDAKGCIFSKNLIQVEATPEEIAAAVKTGDNTAPKTKSVDANSKDSLKQKEKRNQEADGTTSSATQKNGKVNKNKFNVRDSNSNKSVSATASGSNVQTFTGSIGVPAPEVIENAGSDRPFTVNGNTFVGKKVALQRSCDIQHNKCADAANSGGGFPVSDCEKQVAECTKAAGAASKRFITKKRHVSKRSTMSLVKKQVSDFGSCSNPAVKFEVGLDGRKEASFGAVNTTDFNHGSTQKLKITSDFICQQLETKCKAPKTTVDKCKAASEASGSFSGQDAADAFNKALGV